MTMDEQEGLYKVVFEDELDADSLSAASSDHFGRGSHDSFYRAHGSKKAKKTAAGAAATAAVVGVGGGDKRSATSGSTSSSASSTLPESPPPRRHVGEGGGGVQKQQQHGVAAVSVAPWGGSLQQQQGQWPQPEVTAQPGRATPVELAKPVQRPRAGGSGDFGGGSGFHSRARSRSRSPPPAYPVMADPPPYSGEDFGQEGRGGEHLGATARATAATGRVGSGGALPRGRSRRSSNGRSGHGHQHDNDDLVSQSGRAKSTR